MFLQHATRCVSNSVSGLQSMFSARVRAFVNDYLPWYTSEYIDVADRPWAFDLDLEYQMQHQA